MSGHRQFDLSFRDELARLFQLRRDVRRFQPRPVPAAILDRLLALAQLAPSVGLSEPWRFVRVDDPARRALVLADFEACNAQALASQPHERAALYASLKLAGLREAPHHLAVFCDSATPQGRGLGRATMPEMADYSTVLAIHTLWLAARAEGVGLGWVSILDPAAMAGLLDVPGSWRFIAYLCLGYPVEETLTPELETAGWEKRADASATVLQR